MRRVKSRAWVAGSGRSGTTWLGQTLAAPRGVAFLYEPLHSWFASFPPDLDPAITDAGDRPYLAVDARNPSWHRYIGHVLGGWGFTRRTLLAERRLHEVPGAAWRALAGTRLVVKAIRSNLMLGWLTRNFDVRVVLLVRHPCATVASQIGRAWGTKRNVVEVFLRQPALRADHLRDDLETLTPEVLDTPVKRLAARWAIETRVALREAERNPRVLPVTYEDLLQEPQPWLERIFAFLDWTLSPGDWRAVLARHRASAEGALPVAQRLERWRMRLPEAEAEDVLRVVRSLGVDLYGGSAGDRSVPAKPAGGTATR